MQQFVTVKSNNHPLSIFDTEIANFCFFHLKTVFYLNETETGRELVKQYWELKE